MKKWILSFALSILFIGNAFSQVKKVNIDIEGNFEIIVKTDEGTVTVSSIGEIVDVDMNGYADYYESGTRTGKVYKIGATYFDYYESGTRTGKVYKIGATYFDYYESGTRTGKVYKIGATYFDYYESGTRTGKVYKIGSTYFDYYESGTRIGKLYSGNRVVNSDGITFNLKGGY